jgi:hypothetical protein
MEERIRFLENELKEKELELEKTKHALKNTFDVLEHYGESFSCKLQYDYDCCCPVDDAVAAYTWPCGTKCPVCYKKEKENFVIKENFVKKSPSARVKESAFEDGF